MKFKVTNNFIIREHFSGIAVFATGFDCGHIAIHGGVNFCAKRVSPSFKGEDEFELAREWINKNGSKLIENTLEGSKKSNDWLCESLEEVSVCQKVKCGTVGK
jgi:hypothetical protein